MDVQVSILILVDVDQLVSAKIDWVRSARPGAVEIIRVEGLECQRYPAARRTAVEKPCGALADAAIVLLDVGDQLASNRVAVGTIVRGIDLIGIAERPCPVEVQEQHARRSVGEPDLAEAGRRAHHVADAREARAVAADVDTQGIPAILLGREIARQDQAGAEVDGPAVELAQHLGAQLEVPHVLGVRGQLLGRHGFRELKLYDAAFGRIDDEGLGGAVEIAGGAYEIEVASVMQHRLHCIFTRRQP